MDHIFLFCLFIQLEYLYKMWLWIWWKVLFARNKCGLHIFFVACSDYKAIGINSLVYCPLIFKKWWGKFSFFIIYAKCTCEWNVAIWVLAIVRIYRKCYCVLTCRIIGLAMPWVLTTSEFVKIDSITYLVISFQKIIPENDRP